MTITEEGRNRVEMEMKEIKHRMMRVFADMGEADAEEFIRLTRRFADIMQKHMPREQGGIQSD